MPSRREQDLQAAQATYHAWIANGRNATATGRALDIPRTTVMSRLACFRANFLDPAERNQDGSFSGPETPAGFVVKRAIKRYKPDGTPEGETLTLTRDPGEPFEVPPGHTVKGYSTLLDADGRTQAQWVKTKADDEPSVTPEVIKAAFADLPARAKLAPPPKSPDDELCTVYPIADHHIGLLAWDRETHDGDYDVHIATERLRYVADRLVGKSPSSGTAIILQLGDYFHMDDFRNATPGSGNRLDVDGRYQRVIWAGIHAMRDVVDLALQRHGRVIVRNIPGNHDPHSSFALTCALKLYYTKEPRIFVDDDPSEFFFQRFGCTLVGAHHGHRAKPDRLAMLMAEKCPEDWAASKHRWFLAGHVHHDRTVDVGTVRFESFRTLAPADAWHASEGYVSGRSMQAITLHRDMAEVERARVNVF